MQLIDERSIIDQHGRFAGLNKIIFVQLTMKISF